MQQWHPIRIDKSRAIPAGNDRRLTTSSNQVSFHKLYRQKRCYSSKTKFDCGYNSRESNSSFEPKYECGHHSRESDHSFEPKYSNGPSGLQNAQRKAFKESIRSDSPSSCLSTGNAKSDRDLPKRSFDGYSCNLSPEPEFEGPAIKKQKADFSKSLASQHYAAQELDVKPKLSLDETKWMYKNHHAKMSGPYGVKQLMEGWHSHFLQEDLPIYQLYEGQLCKPIPLKQLMDDVKQSRCESGWKHSNQTISNPQLPNAYTEERVVHEIEFPPSTMIDCSRRQSSQDMSQCFTPVYAEERCANDDDLPPGFGGCNSRLSKKLSSDYLPSFSAPAPDTRCSAHSFTATGPEFGDTDISLPPGFEGGPPIESQMSEFCGVSRNFSASDGAPAYRDGGRIIHSDYDQLEHGIHDAVHASWQGNSTQSTVGYSNQVSKTGSELSLNGQTSWTYHPTATCFEPQTVSQPTICIGLPVSQTPSQSWPSASNFPPCNSGVPTADPFNGCVESVLASGTAATRESVAVPGRHSIDPLSLILSELLAVVKRTYVSSVLSALIGEQLDCWFDANKHLLVRSSSFGKDSPSRGPCRVLSRTEVGMCSVEGSAQQVLATDSTEGCTVQAKTSSATIGHPELLSEIRDVKGSDGCCSGSDTASLGETQLSSLVGSKNDAKSVVPVLTVDRLISSNIGESDHGVCKGFSSTETAKHSFPFSDIHREFDLPTNEACMRSSKLSSSMGMECEPTVVVFKRRTHRKLVEGISNEVSISHISHSSGSLSDDVLPSAKRQLLATQSKKENMKSLKQIMLITSKLRSARLKSNLSAKSKGKQSCAPSPEVMKSSQKIGISTCEEYNSCARTSLCMLSWKHRYEDESQRVECCQLPAATCRESGVSSGLQTLGKSAEACIISLRNLATSVEEFDVVKLKLLKVSKKKVKIARSKIHKWGLFSSESVETGDFIIEYVGELVRTRVADVREKFYEKLGVEGDYLFCIDHESTIDATKRGGLARFINHSCDPNCYIKIIVVEGLKRVLIFAKRHIKADEEVTYDYKSSYRVLNFRCSCGSSECTGSIQ